MPGVFLSRSGRLVKSYHCRAILIHRPAALGNLDEPWTNPISAAPIQHNNPCLCKFAIIYRSAQTPVSIHVGVFHFTYLPRILMLKSSENLQHFTWLKSIFRQRGRLQQDVKYPHEADFLIALLRFPVSEEGYSIWEYDHLQQDHID